MSLAKSPSNSSLLVSFPRAKAEPKHDSRIRPYRSFTGAAKVHALGYVHTGSADFLKSMLDFENK